jgi:primosomal protein N' (replication factor Y)
MSGGMYAEVCVGVNSAAVDRPFVYAAPERLRAGVVPGARVIVPFNGRNVEGYVLSVSCSAGVDESRVKEIISAPDENPMFRPLQIELARWLSSEYDTPLAACFKLIMPAGAGFSGGFAAEAAPGASGAELKGIPGRLFGFISENGGATEREIAESFGSPGKTALKRLSDLGLVVIKPDLSVKDRRRRVRSARLNESAPGFGAETEAVLAKGGKRAAVINALLELGEAEVGEIKALAACSEAPVKALAAQGLIIIETVIKERDVMENAEEISPPGITLTPEQAAATARITAEMDKPRKRPFLIHGVTGSGKTEIYLTLIEETIKRGRQAIMLVPEIALTPQACAAFSRRFGGGVTLTHSRMSLSERYDQWRKAYEGRVSVIIGPRSAVFAPFENLGIIVIDEEHEHTYQSETSPKYHVRDLALKLAELTGCIVVSGSATPALTSYFAAKAGKAELIVLKKRVNLTPPEVTVTDMRDELAGGNRSAFGADLRRAVGETLAAGRQALLFLNRRGHSTFVSCRACGYACSCPNCSVNFTYHSYNEKMVCHYCGAQSAPPRVCPACGSGSVRYFGLGTQKLEDEVKALFPGARVLRMDTDTTSRKNAHGRIIGQFAAGGADILVGTQMIAKGLDFPNVTLVGVMAADSALNTGDFRAAETAFQLITQVCGRAGRAGSAGRAIIQTYNPEHYAVCYAARQDYEGFYEKEINVRRLRGYPPYTNIYMILASCDDEKQLVSALHRLFAVMARYNGSGAFEPLGPSPCFVSRLRGAYRWKILIKGENAEKLRAFARYCVNKLNAAEGAPSINWNLTLNPMIIQ